MTEGKKDTSTTTDVAVDPVKAKLLELGATEEVATKVMNDLGATTVEHLNSLTEADLVEAGMQKLPAREAVKQLQKAAVEASAAASSTSNFSFDSILPAPPDDASWLSALKAGGVLKIDESTVISAVRAALASRAGLYDVPSLLVKEMEAFADKNEEQVDPEFFKLRKQLTRTSYADIFAAVEGMDGSYVTEGRKKELLRRIDDRLWSGTVGFYATLKNWYESWATGAANPTLLLGLLGSAMNGGVAMPPGMMQPPDTGVLRDEAAAVADAINKVFAGTGVQISAALAYDATQIKETLTNPRLPAMIGAANREQMLKQLGVAVSPTYPRLEQNLTRFVLAILHAQDQPAGSEEIQYFGSMYMLGSQIPWDQLGASGRGKVTGIGGGRI